MNPLFTPRLIPRIWRCHILGTALLLITLPYAQVLLAQECSATIGAPACSGQTDPGSTSAGYLPSPYVANPIDVVSGNKYQRSDDYLAFGSRLQFTRHYNSADSNERGSLGAGWRHSYDVTLMRASEKRLLLKQSDGRILEFLSARETPMIYRALHAADGYVETARLNQWNLPDGRVLSFKGSKLVEITFADKKHLKLKYKQGRVDTVSDELGRSIKLLYYEGQKTLGSYDENVDGASAGHLRAIQLPDNSLVEYRYDNLQNLIAVDYPENTKSLYRYEDPDFTHHMTSAFEALESIQKHWKYDQYGRAIQHKNESAELTVDVDYAPASEQQGEQVVTVTTSDGWQGSYGWHHNEKLNLPTVTNYQEKACADCKQTEARFSDKSIINWRDEDSPEVVANDAIASKQSAAGKSEVDSHPADNLSFAPVAGALGGEIIVSAVNQSGNGGAINGQRRLKVAVDRVGKIRDMSDGKTSMSQLRAALAQGGTQGCGVANSGQKANSAAAGKCLQKWLNMRQTSKRAAKKYRIPPITNLQNVLINNRFCATPAHRNCDLLRHDYRMAQLSSCAYSDAPCGNGYVKVNPRSIGMSVSDFEKGDFKATLFKNQKTGEYVVAFRGSNPGSIEDIGNNYAQSIGKGSKYYDRAKKLARRLTTGLPNVSYTGHSLGGGLASVAAIESGDKATVFNSASLHPNTVQNRLAEYATADKQIVSYTVDGDLLSDLQDKEIPGNQNVCSLKNSVVISKPRGSVISRPQLVSKPVPSGSFNPAQIRYTRAAPGARIELTPPSASWIRQNSQPRMPRGIVLHTMAAVLESLRNKVIKQCKTLI